LVAPSTMSPSLGHYNISTVLWKCLASSKLLPYKEAVKWVMRFYWPWPSMTLLYNIIYNGKWDTDRNQTRVYLFSFVLWHIYVVSLPNKIR
jgi:hypothetical protein